MTDSACDNFRATSGFSLKFWGSSTKNPVLHVFQTPWQVRYALSKFQPPTTLGEPQNVQKTKPKQIRFFVDFFRRRSGRSWGLAVCAKGLIEPELEGLLGNCETEVDYLFLSAPFRAFVTFFPFLLRIAVRIAEGRSKGGNLGEGNFRCQNKFPRGILLQIHLF